MIYYTINKSSFNNHYISKQTILEKLWSISHGNIFGMVLCMGIYITTCLNKLQQLEVSQNCKKYDVL